MRFIGLILLLLFFNKSNAFQSKQGIDDTSSLKKIRYKELNEFVSYQVIKEGKLTGNRSLIYTFKPIAVYYYLNHGYVVSRESKEVNGSSTDIAKLIQSSKFSGRADFHGIFKINSKIEFKLRPDILKKMSVFPKQQDTKSLYRLMDKLKKEAFVSSLGLDSMSQFSIVRRHNKAKKRIYIKLLLNSKYSNIKSLGVISDQLKKWPDIADAVYVQLFTGRNETDDFFDVTSKIEVIEKKDIAKKNPDPFKTFVDSLKNH
jgi:hypothetical protein